MTPEQFSTVGRLIYGSVEWRRALSQLLKVEPRFVQYWADGTREIPPAIAARLIEEAREIYPRFPTTAARFDAVAEIMSVIRAPEARPYTRGQDEAESARDIPWQP